MENIHDIQNKLIKVSQSWAQKRDFIPSQAQELRQGAIALNHAHYLKSIPIYQKIAREEKVGESADIETIKTKLMFSDGIFKSYNREWLDSCDFSKMNQWLSGIYHKPVTLDSQGIVSIDGWLERLETAGINVAYSSGTSGKFSFIPRGRDEWTLAKTANICCLAPLLTHLNVAASPGRFSLKQAIKLLPPEVFAQAVGKTGLPGYDAFFLGFRRGRMGNQTLMQELAPVFRRHFFLYDIDLSAAALHCLRHGARSREEQQLAEQLQNQVVGQRDRNYLNILERIRDSTTEGQKVFIFGAPYQFKELCEVVSGQKQGIALNSGSLVLFGGGWKSFTGELLSREDLVKKIADCFDLTVQSILEGYSMTEISLLTMRCEYGRFHIPPLIEPVVLDEELNPLAGQDLSGTFGFLDPLAVSHPGFIISGDHVRLVDGECRCGLVGPAVTEIGRAKSREIKGCGGIMGSVEA